MARRDQEPEVIEVVEEAEQPELPFISEGTAKEIELYGSAVHPQTGQRVGVEALPTGRKR